MACRSARDFGPRILEIFDGHVHGYLSKREFMSRAGKYAAAGVTGAMLLEQLRPTTPGSRPRPPPTTAPGAPARSRG